MYVYVLVCDLSTLQFLSLFKRVFDRDHFLKCLFNLLQYCLALHFVFLALVLRPGVEPTPPVLEGEVLTTGSHGKYQFLSFD